MEPNQTTTAATTADQATTTADRGHLIDTAPAEPLVDTVPTAEDTAPKTADTRPEWLPEKFKTPEDLAKSYSELEKKMTTKVPDQYDWQFAKDFGLEDITPEMDKELNLSAAFQSAGLNQDQIDFLLALQNLRSGKIENDSKLLKIEQFEACKEKVENNFFDIGARFYESMISVSGGIGGFDGEVVEQTRTMDPAVNEYINSVLSFFLKQTMTL